MKRAAIPAQRSGGGVGYPTGLVDPTRGVRPVFVYPGQGGHWRGMGLGLAATEPVFRDVLEACDAALAAETGGSVIRDLEEGAPGDIARVQPMVFAVQVSLTALWRAWGVHPAAAVGHSMGDVAAAAAVGVLSLRDAAAVIARRSLLLARLRGRGAMLLVAATVEEARDAVRDLERRVGIAAVNGPRTTVLSGDPEAIALLAGTCEARGWFCRRVNVDVAAHSPQIDEVRSAMQAALVDVRPMAGEVPFYAGALGARIDGASATGDFWARSMREPVEFHRAISTLVREGHRVFLEVSPHPLLVPSIVEVLSSSPAPFVAIGSLRRAENDRSSLRASAARLFGAGVDVVGTVFQA